jgi:NADH-quinone oxidoreductase subunit G
MGTFYVDDRAIPFSEGDTVIEAAHAAGIDIPHFCYHPALGSLGACRLCMVALQPSREGERPRTLAACMLEAQEGMRVSLSADKAVDARQSVIELVMTNHPHDCPVCDEAGECDLQNMTVEVGPAYRRYQGSKRTFLNQHLGPLVWHDMDRCITCYRCVRFYQDYALGTDLGALGSRNRVYFGRATDGALESPFAGNLVEVCPTGVFTDKVFRRHYSRVWDLQTAPSVCPHCSVGCNTLPGARHGTLRRVTHRANRRVNEWFICDRGRYGHGYSEGPERPLKARIDGREGELTDVLAAIADRLADAHGVVAGLGSVREDMEGNAALRSLMAAMGGWYSAHASPYLEAAIAEAAAASDQAPTLSEIAAADALLVVGDLTGHAPMMDLCARQVVRAGHPLVLLHSVPVPLATHATQSLSLAPAELVGALTILRRRARNPNARANAALKAVSERIAQARRPVLLGVAETLGAAGCRALAQLAKTVGARCAFALPGANAFGTALLSRPGDGERVLSSVENGEVDTLIVLGSDPFGSDPGAARWRAVRSQLKLLVVLDCIATETARRADAFMPLAAVTERAGTFVNYAGLAQGYGKVFAREPALPDPYSAISDLGHMVGLSRIVRNAEVLAYKYLDRPPSPGRTGIKVESSAYTHLRASAEADFKPVAAPSGHWQAALVTWYGDDPLAAFAPELSSLAPAAAAYIAPGQGAEADPPAAGTSIRLRGPLGEIDLPLRHETGCAKNTLGLNRAAMAVLGVSEGEGVEWEPLP